MTGSMTPPHAPTITRAEADAIAAAYKIDTSKPWILGRRGHWQDTMGEIDENDRGIYDDALWVITPDKITGFIANTDPSRYRKGSGFGIKKGMAILAPGVYDYQLGWHKGKYKALVQAGEVTVIRDGNPPYPDKGWFGINHHKGGIKTTSSLGCQTVPPSYYLSYYLAVEKAMKEHGITKIKYCLVEGQGK